MIVIYLCSLCEFFSFTEGLGNINVVIVVALLSVMGILWVPLVLVLVFTVFLYQNVSKKDQHSQVLNPDECHTTISKKDLRSSNSQSVKNIKISIDQSSLKINALDESFLHCSDYQTFPNECSFIVLLKLLEIKDTDKLTRLPYAVKIHEEDAIMCQSTCYVSITVSAAPLSSSEYSELQRSQGYYLKQKKHSELGLTCLDFAFVQSQTKYKITFRLISAIDENGRDIIFMQSSEITSTCCLQTVCKSVCNPNISPARLKLQGPLKGNNYLSLTKNYRKLIYSGDIETVRQITEELLASSEPFDIKVVALIHSGHSHQTRSYKTPNCFEDSERELDEALKMCWKSDCVNTEFLKGRTYTFKAQNYIYAERYEDARHCIRKAKEAFCFVADCTEMSGLVYQEIMILSIDPEFEVINTDGQKRKLKELIEKAVSLARMGSDYQAIQLTAFMLIKKAMLHLGIFNLLHTRFQRKKSTEDFKPSHQDILEAKHSLTEVSQEFIQDPEVSRYKALYYFALSDYHRHAGNIIEARDNLKVVWNQVNNGKFAFPLKQIKKRHTLLSKLTTNDSIQDIFDNRLLTSSIQA